MLTLDREGLASKAGEDRRLLALVAVIGCATGRNRRGDGVAAGRGTALAALRAARLDGRVEVAQLALDVGLEPLAVVALEGAELVDAALETRALRVEGADLGALL